MAEKSEGTDKTEGKRKCQYKYKSPEMQDKDCPHEPLPDGGFCIFHEEITDSQLNNAMLE